MTGAAADGRIETVRIVPEGSAAANYGFDVTPARLITATDHRARRDPRRTRRGDRRRVSGGAPKRRAPSPGMTRQSLGWGPD